MGELQDQHSVFDWLPLVEQPISGRYYTVMARSDLVFDIHTRRHSSTTHRLLVPYRNICLKLDLYCSAVVFIILDSCNVDYYGVTMKRTYRNICMKFNFYHDLVA